MMMDEKPFEGDSRRIIDVMMQKPMLSGRELSNLSGIAPEMLYDAVRPLIYRGFIVASGNYVDALSVPSAYFTLLPSVRRSLSQ